MECLTTLVTIYTCHHPPFAGLATHGILLQWKMVQSLENYKQYREHQYYLLTWCRKCCFTCWKLWWNWFGRMLWWCLKVLDFISPKIVATICPVMPFWGPQALQKCLLAICRQVIGLWLLSTKTWSPTMVCLLTVYSSWSLIAAVKNDSSLLIS